MTDDWSLKGKSIKGLIAMPSDGMETHPTSSPTPIKDEWFHKEDIETLRKKLIEDAWALCGRYRCNSIMKRAINKRFGVEK